MALKTELKEVEAERDSLRPALTFLAKDLKPVICNHDSTEKRNQKAREITEELVEVKKKKYTQASHSKENAAKDTNTILLSKLSNYLIQENAQYNWFKSFLKIELKYVLLVVHFLKPAPSN